MRVCLYCNVRRLTYRRRRVLGVVVLQWVWQCGCTTPSVQGNDVDLKYLGGVCGEHNLNMLLAHGFIQLIRGDS